MTSMKWTALISSILLASCPCTAFTSPKIAAPPVSNQNVALKARSDPRHDEQESTVSRRGWFIDITTKTVGFLSAGALMEPPRPSYASVYVDPDRYGDKELKVATVNKLRQTIRDVILKEPQLAPLFVKVAIQDALTYNSSTGEGGPDGTIVSVIRSSDAPASLVELKPAAIKLSEIADGMKRTTEITMADVVAFAGAEAIESTGGPRVAVQLGKMDPAQESSGSSPRSYPDLGSNASNGNDVVNAFLNSGLTERDVAVLIGTVGGMEKVVSSAQPGDEGEEEEEENEMGDKDIFIPTSFGGPKQIYGEQLGTMDNSIFDLKKGKQPYSAVFKDEKVDEWAAKYAGKKLTFLKDVPQAYEKLMGLGTRYTGRKVGSLLGGGESDI